LSFEFLVAAAHPGFGRPLRGLALTAGFAGWH